MERLRGLSAGARLLLIWFFMLVGMVVAVAMITTLAPADDSSNTPLLTQALLQDFFVFIAPAVIAMWLFHGNVARAMALDRAPQWRHILLVIIFYVVSLPAMNWLVQWNQHLSLPDSLASVEQWMRAQEDAAAVVTKKLLDVHSPWRAIATILVVGVAAGVSEEMLFRGAMLRTLLHPHNPLNLAQNPQKNNLTQTHADEQLLTPHSSLLTHIKVWLVAALFSAIHMQFFGFFPRLILGVWFGYLLVVTRNLWVPIIAHVLNNSVVVANAYISGTPENSWADTVGTTTGTFPWLALLSAIAAIAIFVAVIAPLLPAKKKITE